jgi:flagellar biosynthesis anti-sigma factor FlgM
MDIKDKPPPYKFEPISVNSKTRPVDHSMDKAFKNPNHSDPVQLSPLAKKVRAVHQHLDQLPDIRNAKVAEIKKRLDEGTYRVDAQKVAAKLIQEALMNDYWRDNGESAD